jgi:uncharacterized protein YifN (PemK superfamily)
MKKFCIVTRDNNEERAGQYDDLTPDSHGRVFITYVGNYDERAEWIDIKRVRKVSSKELSRWYTSKTTLSGMYMGPLSGAS